MNTGLNLSLQMPAKLAGLLSCLLLAAGLASCGMEKTAQARAQGSQGVGIPFPVEKGVTALTGYDLFGKQAEQRSGGSHEQGSSLVLTASATTVEYAVYRFNVGIPPDQVDIMLHHAQTTAAWIGLANYTIGRWEISGPYSGTQSLQLSEDHVSPLGNSYITVFVDRNDLAQIDELELHVPNKLPLPSFTAIPATGPAPLPVAFDAGASSDSDGTIVSYEWDFDGDGFYDLLASSPLADHTYAGPGLFGAKLRVTDDGGQQAVYTSAIDVGVPGNNSPAADIQADPTTGSPPLTVNLDASSSSDSDGSIARYDWDFEGDGVWDALDAAASLTQVYSNPGMFDATVRVTDNVGAQAVAAIEIHVNSSPVAQIVATPPSCDKDESIEFDAAGSFDPDGIIVRYEWDTDGDGSFDTDTGPTPTHIVTFHASGRRLVTTRVTDDNGATSTASITITVHGTVIVTLTNSNNPWGCQTSLAVVAGTPAISCYRLGPSRALMYSRASTTTGANSADWSVLIVDYIGFTNLPTSLAVINSCPAISYGDTTTGKVRFAHSTTATGGSPSDWVKVDVDTGLPAQGALAEVGGNPAICYAGDYPKSLKYARSTTSSGSSPSDWKKIMIDSGNFDADVGLYASLAVVDGNPAIAYYDGINANLKYARSVSATGSVLTDWDKMTVDDSSSDVGLFTSLAIIDGKPAISYWDYGHQDLYYAHASTPSGGREPDWTTIVRVGDLNYDTPNTSLAAISGLPFIAYNSLSMLYAISSTPSGEDADDWNSGNHVEAYAGEYCSICEVAGCPAFSYWDETDSRLKYAIIF